MSTDVEEYLRHVMTETDIPAVPLDEQSVISMGHRVRVRRRRRNMTLGVAAAAVLAVGVAEATVPATGTPLSRVVWAAGDGFAQSETGAWMQVNENRYVMSVRDAYLGDRATLVISRMQPDASVVDLMASGPIRAEDMPMIGMAVSTEVGVEFSLFPDGTTNIKPITTNSQTVPVSTMRISSPHGGPDYVAVASGGSVSGYDAITGYTWIDSVGVSHSQRLDHNWQQTQGPN